MECYGLSFVILLITIFSFASQQACGKVCNVKNYGAVGDDSTDNSKAFVNAWADACGSTTTAQVVVPAGEYRIKSVLFKGPCQGAINFLLSGTIRAFEGTTSEQSIISFQYVDKLLVSGNGVIDGNGPSAWPAKSQDTSLQLPFSIGFDFVTNSVVTGITSKDSKGTHINVFACTSLEIKGVHVVAPADSPNTDGIRISSSTSVSVTSSRIGTGDDCISMLSGNHNITITDSDCGPGHGISLGSLGKYSSEKDFSGLRVYNCSLYHTTNGLRIKTVGPSLSNILVSSIHFENIMMYYVQNPIIIDQNYCPSDNCPKGASSVRIQDVSFTNIRGISDTEEAVQLFCSPTNPCTQITLKDIRLTYSGNVLSTSSCQNAGGDVVGVQLPSPCIS